MVKNVRLPEIDRVKDHWLSAATTRNMADMGIYDLMLEEQQIFNHQLQTKL
jgi:hypothetical protein